MSDLAKFLAAIAPDLLALGSALFQSTRGNTRTARRALRSRISELAKERAKIDAQARKRFGGR